MPRTIIRLERDGDVRYMEWSSITDGPRTYLMVLETFRDYYRAEYGQDGMRGLSARIERADRFGTSHLYDRSLDDAIGYNRAGPFETQLTTDEIWVLYRIERPRRIDPLSEAERRLVERARSVLRELWEADDGPVTARDLALRLGMSTYYLYYAATGRNGDHEDG